MLISTTTLHAPMIRAVIKCLKKLKVCFTPPCPVSVSLENTIKPSVHFTKSSL